MRIVNRATFLALPAGTVYAKYDPCVFDHLTIKGGTWSTDFLYQAITDSFAWTDDTDFGDKLEQARNGTPVPMDFDTTARDGLFDEDQLFAVWDRPDVEALITRLHQALNESAPEQIVSNDDPMPTGDAFMKRFYSADLMTTNPWWMGQA